MLARTWPAATFPLGRLCSDGERVGGERPALHEDPGGWHPEGALRFRRSDLAILTIEPSQEIPVEDQVFFAVQGDDNEFYLAPPIVTSAAIQMPITHFSGYGVSKGFEADLEPVRQRLGGSVEARLQAIMARHLSEARQCQLLGVAEDEAIDPAFFEWYLKTWFNEVLKPRLDAAKESCAAGQLALQTFLGMERSLQLLGYEEGVVGVMRAAGLAAEANSMQMATDLGKEVAEVCLKEEYELCRDEHILHRIVPITLSLERQSQLLGGGMAGLYEKGMEYAGRCLRFRLEFESNLEGDYMGQFSYETERSATIDLTFNPNGVMAGNAITGKGTLTSDSFDIHL